MTKKKTAARRHWASVGLLGKPEDEGGPCHDGKAWALTQPSISVAWKTCGRGDWMIWWIEKTMPKTAAKPTLRAIVGTAVDAAREALPHAGQWRPELERILGALDRYVAGEELSRQEIEEARAAAWAAEAAAGAAAWAAEAAAWAAEAAARAADAAARAADAAARAADAAARAADAAAWAAEVAARAAAKAAFNVRLADIVRKHFPKPPRPVKK